LGPSVAPETLPRSQLATPLESVLPWHDELPSVKVTVCPDGLGAGEPPSLPVSFSPSSTSLAVTVVPLEPARMAVVPVRSRLTLFSALVTVNVWVESDVALYSRSRAKEAVTV